MHCSFHQLPMSVETFLPMRAESVGKLGIVGLVSSENSDTRGKGLPPEHTQKYNDRKYSGIIRSKNMM